MKTQHTPGPWAVDAPKTTDNIAILEAADSGDDWRFAIAMVYPQGYDGAGLEHMKQRQAANARLIAAAPRMLSALVDCAEYLAEFFEEGRDHPAIVAADDAIVCAVPDWNDGDPDRSPVRLLSAAAPDLLAALEHMLGACDPTIDREDDEHFDYADAYIACDRARAAIAKARGEE